ncbi:MAG: 16S rRNA (guanine(527)-N(7))-methyltransferase RsmG [Bacteroidales bacterium]|nr:16S rRNA (guanine(527)-N(7))-methyltransferase RsmG [Bacteroidales bacterium]
MQTILSYFPGLDQTQRTQLQELDKLYRHWNAQINVISRKDIDNLMVHHVLHSMAIAKVINFARGTRIMDIGTGGGFPGIPLAILFPLCHFTLVDSIGKKTIVAQEVANALGLTNVTVVKSRAEDIPDKFDFVVSRAVAPIAQLIGWSGKSVKPGGSNSLPNGMIFLKGGDISEELKPYRRHCERWNIQDFFEEEYFAEKYIVFIPS